MKITTKTGDNGETSLFGGRRVSKVSRIIEVIGELDELQAVVGWCKVGAGLSHAKITDRSVVTSLRLQIRGLRAEAKILARVEDDLYRIMSIVGFEFKCPKNIKAISEADVRRLEKEIEKCGAVAEAKLKTAAPFLLKKFVRPGKSDLSARLHIARTVCRRVERGVCGLRSVPRNEKQKTATPFLGNGSSHKQQTVAGEILKYLNRLSDLLFVMACVA